MPDNEKIGLEAVFESEDFQQGIAEYNAAISEAVGATGDGADEMGVSWDSLAEAVDETTGRISDSLADMQTTVEADASAAADSIGSATEEMGTDTGAWADAAQTDSESVAESISGAGDAAENTAEKTSNSTSSMSLDFSALGDLSVGVFAAIAAAIAAMALELALATNAASDSQDVMAELDFQVSKTGKSSGITKDQVLGLADSLSKVLPIDDEVITQAITMGMRFDGVTKNNIEPLIKAAADLSISTGKDLPSSMKELALAITDPDKAMRLFKDANITLSDQQLKILKHFKETGNTAATESLILGELNGKIGGLAETMGTTASGKAKIMQTALGNLQEEAGAGFLDAMGEASDALADFANDPELLADIKEISGAIGKVASVTISGTIAIASTLSQNKGIIIGALTAITVALALLAAVAVAVFLATAEISIPILAVGLAVAAVAAGIGIAVGFMATAWTENWFDIQGVTAAVWAALQPIFQAVATILSVVIGAAISALVFQWNTLVSAMTAVVAWVNTNLMPLFRALGNLFGAVVGLQLRVLGSQFDILRSAMKEVYDWANKNIVPIFQEIGNVIDNYLMPIIRPLADFLNYTLTAAFNAIGWAVQSLINLINTLASALNNLSIPDNLTPGSPTPFELGLRGINEELAKMAGATLPAVRYQMDVIGSVRDVQGITSAGAGGSVSNSSQSTKNYLFGPKFNVNNGGLGSLLQDMT